MIEPGSEAMLVSLAFCVVFVLKVVGKKRMEKKKGIRMDILLSATKM